MIQKRFAPFLLALLLALMLIIPSGLSAEEENTYRVDKELCAKMLRFGKQAYMRGKYLDAKEYFRKAVKADPDSTSAWVYYDMAVVFALAEKVEKNADLVLPGVSTRKESGQAELSETPPSPEKQEKEKEDEIEFEIVEDEGC